MEIVCAVVLLLGWFGFLTVLWLAAERHVASVAEIRSAMRELETDSRPPSACPDCLDTGLDSFDAECDHPRNL